MNINKRKLKYASVSTVFIVLFVVVVLLFNMLVGFLTTRFSLKIDLTKSGDYKFSDQTKDLVKNVDQDITIYVMSSEAMLKANTQSARIMETIHRYSSESGNKIKSQVIDPNQNPKFFDKYPLAKAKKEGESSAFLIVESPLRYTTVQKEKMIGKDESGRNEMYNVEAEVSSAILYVTSKDVSKVATVTGHNEIKLEALNKIFDGNNFERTEINLMSADIPEGVNNLVVAGPTVDFTADEITKLDNFLQKPGNNLFMFWNSEAGKLEVFERFLSEWGFQIDNSIILDPNRSYQSPIAIISELGKNEVTKSIGETQQLLITPLTHPIKILWDEKGYTHVVSMANSSNGSFAKVLDPNNPLEPTKNANDEAGPFSTVVMAEKNVQKDTAVQSNRVFVFGSAEVANESIMGIPVTMNNTFLTTLISYCNENTKTMEIAPKMTRDYDLNFYESQVRMMMVIFLIILPLVMLGIGMYMFIKRRHQ